MSADDPMSDADADALRVAFASALLLPRDLVACPPAEVVWDAVHHHLHPARRQEVIDHTGICPMCAEAWRLAVRGAPDPKDRR